MCYPQDTIRNRQLRCDHIWLGSHQTFYTLLKRDSESLLAHSQKYTHTNSHTRTHTHTRVHTFSRHSARSTRANVTIKYHEGDRLPRSHNVGSVMIADAKHLDKVFILDKATCACRALYHYFTVVPGRSVNDCDCVRASARVYVCVSPLCVFTLHLHKYQCRMCNLHHNSCKHLRRY